MHIIRALAVLPIAIFLGGCPEGTVFDERGCPRERVYTKAEQVRIANELKKAGPALKGVVVDYGKLRDKVRACRGQ